MNQASFMGVVQGIGDRGRQFRSLAKGQASVFDLLGQIGALNELRDHETQAVRGAADIMNRDNMRVIQAGKHAGLGQICLGVFRFDKALTVRDLDGHLPFQVVIVSQVNGTETALAQELHHSEATNSLWDWFLKALTLWRQARWCGRSYRMHRA
jgi:hypothetical protein